MVSYNITRTARRKSLRDMWDAFMRWGGKPTIPDAPYMEEPPIDAPRYNARPPEGYGRYSPIDLDLSPIKAPPTVMDVTGLPMEAPPVAPPVAPAPVAPPAGDMGWPMADEEIMRAAAGIRGTAPMSAAPAPMPEEQWMLDEREKIAEIRGRASAIAPQYADYGQPIPEAEFLWSETQTPEQVASRREALGQQLAKWGKHRFHGIKPPEHFAERRARRRERQLERGAPPTWTERAEHETGLAKLGRTYPPATKEAKARTREDVLDELIALEKMKSEYAPFTGEDGREYPGDPAQYAVYNDLVRAKQDELAAMEGGEVVTRAEETSPFVDRQWPWSNVPAVKEPVRRFRPTGDVKLQSAPDVQLDPYWDKLDDVSKQQLWQIYEDPEKLKIALQRLQQTYGAIR